MSAAFAAPIAPPGWYCENTAATSICNSFEMTTASASPRASAMVVEVVGAGKPKESISDLWIGAGSRIVSGLRLTISHVEGCMWDVSTISGSAESK